MNLFQYKMHNANLTDALFIVLDRFGAAQNLTEIRRIFLEDPTSRLQVLPPFNLKLTPASWHGDRIKITEPIFIARDNGTSVVTIAEDGTFHVENSTQAPILSPKLVFFSLSTAIKISQPPTGWQWQPLGRTWYQYQFSSPT
jgi:hypothetical protein